MNPILFVTRKSTMFHGNGSEDGDFSRLLMVFSNRPWISHTIGDSIMPTPRSIDGVFFMDEDTFQGMSGGLNDLLQTHPRYIVLPKTIDLTQFVGFHVYQEREAAGDEHMIWMRDRNELIVELTYFKVLGKII
ncbi:MAG: hypothetical protein ACKOZY_04480 [Flavobacteriales bacterium]